MISINWNEINKVYIIHHDDMDGKFAAYVTKQYCEVEKNINDIEYIEANYTFNPLEPFYHKDLSNSLIFIVDYSTSVEAMVCLFRNVTVKERNIVWIDHHISAIDKFSRLYPKIHNIPGLRCSDEFCGAELAYLYLYENVKNVSRDPFTPSYIKDSREVTRKNLTDLIQESSMSTLSIVGDYDTFRSNVLTNAHAFHLYFRTYCPEFKNSNECTEFFNIVLNKDNLDDIIRDGKIMKDYVDANNKFILDTIGCKSILRKFEDIEIIAVNTNMKNSTVFDSVKDDYEVGIVYHYNAKIGRMLYSLYRLNKNPDRFISCAKIAESFGGGGHERSAGFSTSGILELKPKIVY